VNDTAIGASSDSTSARLAITTNGWLGMSESQTVKAARIGLESIRTWLAFNRTSSGRRRTKPGGAVFSRSTAFTNVLTRCGELTTAPIVNVWGQCLFSPPVAPKHLPEHITTTPAINNALYILQPMFLSIVREINNCRGKPNMNRKALKRQTTARIIC